MNDAFVISYGIDSWLAHQGLSQSSNHRPGVRFIFSALNNDISTKYTGTCRIKVQVNQPSAKKTRT